MAFLQKTIYLEQKMEQVINLDDIKTVNEHIAFQYFLTQILQYNLVLVELNIFHMKYWTNSEINLLLTIYLGDESIVCILLYCFHRVYTFKKKIVTLYQFISSKWLQRMTNNILNILKINMAEDASVDS